MGREKCRILFLVGILAVVGATSIAGGANPSAKRPAPDPVA